MILNHPFFLLSVFVSFLKVCGSWLLYHQHEWLFFIFIVYHHHCHLFPHL